MPRNNTSTSYYEKVINFFTPSLWFKYLCGFGLLVTLANLVTNRPDIVADKTADVVIASASLLRGVGEEAVKGKAGAVSTIVDGTYKAVWGTSLRDVCADTIKSHLLEYIPPVSDTFSVFSALWHPYERYYGICLEMYPWRVLRVDLVIHLRWITLSFTTNLKE